MTEFIDGYRHTRCRPEEIVTAILVPKRSSASRGHFIKLGARKYLVISIVMVAGVVEVDRQDRITAARLAIGSCSAVPQRLPALEAAQPSATAAELAAASHLAGLTPIDDIRGSGAYRREAALALTRDLLRGLTASSRRRAA